MKGGYSVTNGGRRLRRFAPYGLAIAFSAVAVTGNLASIADDLARSGRPVAMFIPIVDEITSSLAWLALLPVIILAARLALPPRMRVIPALAVHAALIPVVSLSHFVLTRLMRGVFHFLRGEDFVFRFSWSDYVYDLYRDVLTYLLFALLCWGVERFLAARMEARDRSGAVSSEVETLVLEVRDGAQTIYVHAADILWTKAAGNYVELHLKGGRTLLMRTTLARLEERLGEAGFLRIHRSRLVNASAISAVQTLPSGDATLSLVDGSSVLASRRHRLAMSRTLAARSLE